VASKDISSKCRESNRISPKLRSLSGDVERATGSVTKTGVASALLFRGVLLNEGSLFKREVDGRLGRGSGKTSSTGVAGPEEVEDSVESVLDGPRESRDKLGRVGEDGEVKMEGPASEFSESLEAENRFKTEKRRRLTLGTDVEVRITGR